MKKVLSVLLSAVMLLSLVACSAGAQKTPTPENPTIRLSTTTSVNDSGLLPYLLPYFEEETGYKVEVQSAGTGAALQKAKDGNADLVLVHAKASEEEFIGEGYGVERLPFMYNFFVIVGPADDPAQIKSSANANEAFSKIAQTQSNFVTRGDDSGTHKAELKIWGKDNAPNAETDKWYISAGQGMGACLTMASEKNAYCLTDKATFLSMKNDLKSEILVSESDDLKNTYSLIAVNPEKIDGLNVDGANALISWMTGDEAKKLIAQYGEQEYGEALFYLIED